MEAQKLEIIQKIEAKGLTVEKVAEAIQAERKALALATEQNNPALVESANAHLEELLQR